MSESEIEATVLEILGSVAPEAGDLRIDPEVNFREQFDFDSLDFLNFALALNERLGIEIPESDYPKLSSLAGCVRYLSDRLAAKADA